VSRYQKGKNNLDFKEARDSEWQWHQLGRMQVCTLLQTDNHASTSLLSFLQVGCPSCRPTNSVKALKAAYYYVHGVYKTFNQLPRDHVTVGVGAPLTAQTRCTLEPITTVSLRGLSMKNGAKPESQMTHTNLFGLVGT